MTEPEANVFGYYLIFIWRGVDISVTGPFKTFDILLENAKRTERDPTFDSIFYLHSGPLDGISPGQFTDDQLDSEVEEPEFDEDLVADDTVEE